MNILRFSSVAALVAFAAPAMASTIVVDDFSTDGGVSSNSGGNPATTTVFDAGILGGSRFMWASNDDGSGLFDTSFEASGGTLSFNNGANQTGQAVLIYDGGVGAGVDFEFFFNDLPTLATMTPTGAVDDDGTVGVSEGIEVDIDGLTADLLRGALPASRKFTFDLSSFDELSTIDFRAYAWDLDGNLATYDELLSSGAAPGDLAFTTDLGLDAFENTAAMDWSRIGALAFSVESITEEFNGDIDDISVVPLPASALLLLGGLGGLAGISASANRRRRRS